MLFINVCKDSEILVIFVIFAPYYIRINIMKDEKVKTQLNIEIPADLEEVYSNLAVIAHSSSEFVFDFIRVMPNMPKSKVKSRVIMNAEHAKRLMYALQQNIEKYEQQFGEIVLPENRKSMPISNWGFKGEA